MLNSETAILTVMLVTYNHKDSLAKSLDSIINQKTTYKFEIWVLDDCSTDGTTEIVKEYAQKYPDYIVTHIRPKNLGVVQNVYQALCCLNTKYFAIFDADDYWIDENKIQLQIDALEKNSDCTLCGHNVMYVYHEKKKTSLETLNNIQEKYTIYNAPYVHPSSRIYRNLVDFSKEDPEFITWDITCFYKHLSLGKLYYIDKVMSKYNVTGKGMSSSEKNLEKNKNRDQLIYFRIDQYFKFKYHEVFKNKYLQEKENTLFNFSVKLFNREFNFKFTKRRLVKND